MALVVDESVQETVLDDIIVLANKIRSEYNRKRELWYRKSTRYFHQALASSYCSEDDLIKDLEECRALKKRYNDVCRQLKALGCNYDLANNWTIEMSKDRIFTHTN